MGAFDLKSIEFSEDQLNDLQKIAEELFGESNDPRSYAYNRIHVRPQINWWIIALNCICQLVTLGAIYTLLTYSLGRPPLSVSVTLLCFLLYLLVNAKRVSICLIRIYQRYAPDSVRNKCRFEPSCSQYMIMALQKYGLIKGLKKGIDRLKRCNINNGGFDLP